VTVRAIGQDALVELYENEPSFRFSLVSVFTQRLLQDLEIMRDREGGTARRTVRCPARSSGFRVRIAVV